MSSTVNTENVTLLSPAAIVTDLEPSSPAATMSPVSVTRTSTVSAELVAPVRLTANTAEAPSVIGAARAATATCVGAAETVLNALPAVHARPTDIAMER